RGIEFSDYFLRGYDFFFHGIWLEDFLVLLVITISNEYNIFIAYFSYLSREKWDGSEKWGRFYFFLSSTASLKKIEPSPFF
ncbi:MAG: hypothetical protein WC335_08945, partial [Candidatus Omnitrophota bacterium]